MFRDVRWRLPDRKGRVALGCALLTWAGVMAGTYIDAGWPVVLMGMVAIGLLIGGRPTLATILGLAVVAGALHSAREARTLTTETEAGLARLQLVATSDSAFGLVMARVEAAIPLATPPVPILLRTSEPVDAGERIVVAGRLSAETGRWRGIPYGATFDARRVESRLGPSNRWFAVANTVRRRVVGVFAERDDAGSALVRGLLIGDTSGISPRDLGNLQGAGLSHYVAVSGSNVALFLGTLWVLLGPVGFDVRVRAAVGTLGIVFFVLVTRWEPSVLRASLMAAMVLSAKAVGYPMSAWASLGAAATALLLIAPQLAMSAGFQLSVAATIGVMVAADWFPRVRPRPLRQGLAASVGAQLAVAPVLLLWFGSVPAAAPLANVLAAPLVVVATTLGGVAGVTGWAFLASVASASGGVVLEIAEASAGAPALGPPAFALVLSGLAIPSRRGRVAVLSAVLVATLVGGSRPLAPGSVLFLDIGQGDAALIVTPAGQTVLIDGGPDGQRLTELLARHQVRAIDLMILSHPHADHVTGLEAAARALPVGTLWHPGFAEPGPIFEDLVAALEEQGAPIVIPRAGTQHAIGGVRLDVLGPVRRYASPNDQSLVVLISTSSASVLFPGDIEAVAQADLGPLVADIMKVPHQGAATTDLDWLSASSPALAVISVGPNSFGHPAQEIIDVLESEGASVVRTDEHGSVLIRLDRPLGPVSGVRPGRGSRGQRSAGRRPGIGPARRDRRDT